MTLELWRVAWVESIRALPVIGDESQRPELEILSSNGGATGIGNMTDVRPARDQG